MLSLPFPFLAKQLIAFHSRWVSFISHRERVAPFPLPFPLPEVKEGKGRVRETARKEERERHEK